jgi:AbrB family looped-hinge helix DNA binding protein
VQQLTQTADPRGNLIGITRPIDQLGRVVIPREIRSSLGITTNSLLEIFPYDNGMFIRPHGRYKTKGSGESQCET